MLPLNNSEWTKGSYFSHLALLFGNCPQGSQHRLLSLPHIWQKAGNVRYWNYIASTYYTLTLQPENKGCNLPRSSMKTVRHSPSAYFICSCALTELLLLKSHTAGRQSTKASIQPTTVLRCPTHSLKKPSDPE